MSDPNIDDLKNRIEELQSQIGSSGHDITLTDKEREEFEGLWRDAEDLGPDERERYKNIQATLAEEGDEDDGTSKESLTSAEKELLDLMLDTTVYDEAADTTEGLDDL